MADCNSATSRCACRALPARFAAPRHPRVEVCQTRRRGRTFGAASFSLFLAQYIQRRLASVQPSSSPHCCRAWHSEKKKKNSASTSASSPRLQRAVVISCKLKRNNPSAGRRVFFIHDQPVFFRLQSGARRMSPPNFRACSKPTNASRSPVSCGMEQRL